MGAWPFAFDGSGQRSLDLDFGAAGGHRLNEGVPGMITVRAMRAGLYGGLSALAILAAAAPAAAQDVAPDASADADSSTEIIVTGSRIARTDADTIQPTLVTTADQIDRRGYTNVAQALSEIAAFGVPGNSNVGAQEGPFGSGRPLSISFRWAASAR